MDASSGGGAVVTPGNGWATGQLASGEAMAHLHRLAAALADAPGPGPALDAVVDHVVRGLGAQAGAVLLRAHADAPVTIGAHQGLPPEAVAMFPKDPEPDLPLREALGARVSIYIETKAQMERWYPELAGTSFGIHASAYIPLTLRGETHGVLGVGYAGEHRFGETERIYCEVVADLCALSLARFGVAPT